MAPGCILFDGPRRRNFSTMGLSRAELLDARRRVTPHVHRTPVLTSTNLDRRAQANLYFKCENLQKSGSFKIRGATNALGSLLESTEVTAVATHSSGNFAQALALAATKHGLKSHIVMPRTASSAKREAVLSYGGRIVECDPTLEAREATAASVVADTGATLIHPYDDLRVVAGQATAAMELIEDTGELTHILTPVGGGGLVSGTALAAHFMCPGTQVWGGEPSGADDAFRSLQEGVIVPNDNPRTIADGLLTDLGRHTFPIIREYVAGIVVVDDGQITAAMRLLWERMKLVVEPSGAVALAAVLHRPDIFAGGRVGVILSGGNVDLSNLPF